MTPRRLRAPSTDGSWLSEPAPDHAPGLLESNRALLTGWDHDFQGRSSSHLRPLIRQQAMNLARAHLRRLDLAEPDPIDESAPIVVTGHQPELFHPGVWVKNFAAFGLAQRASGLALNLIVDNDIPKSSSIRLPLLDDGRLRTRLVEFDPWTEEVPYEDWAVRDERVFESFPQRVLETGGKTIRGGMLAENWSRAVAAASATDRVGLRFSAMRHAREAAWGVKNLELPLSALCETEGFLWFACHLLAQLPRFRQVHNQSLDRYRKLYHIRSANHPVADLSTDGTWSESPFWAWRSTRPRRRALLVRQTNDRTMHLRLGGEAEPFLELPLGPDREACCAVERLRELPAMGIRLRTRALTTTMFARLLLGDLFLHGIGGSKYDELGDEIVRSFFGFAPPPFWTLSLTHRLGMPESPATAGELRQVGREIRSVRFNPDRWLVGEPPAEVAKLLAKKRQALAGATDLRRQRVNRYHELRWINDALLPHVSDQLARLEARRSALRAGLAWNQVAQSREYAWPLHSEARLQAALAPWASPSPPSASGG